MPKSLSGIEVGSGQDIGKSKAAPGLSASPMEHSSTAITVFAPTPVRRLQLLHHAVHAVVAGGAVTIAMTGRNAGTGGNGGTFGTWVGNEDTSEDTSEAATEEAREEACGYSLDASMISARRSGWSGWSGRSGAGDTSSDDGMRRAGEGGEGGEEEEGPTTLLFVYGTLKRRFANFVRYLGVACSHGGALFLGSGRTVPSFPLVCRPPDMPPLCPFGYEPLRGTCSVLTRAMRT